MPTDIRLSYPASAHARASTTHLRVRVPPAAWYLYRAAAVSSDGQQSHAQMHLSRRPSQALDYGLERPTHISMHRPSRAGSRARECITSAHEHGHEQPAICGALGPSSLKTSRPTCGRHTSGRGAHHARGAHESERTGVVVRRRAESVMPAWGTDGAGEKADRASAGRAFKARGHSRRSLSTILFHQFFFS